jgi:hypothetical protein
MTIRRPTLTLLTLAMCVAASCQSPRESAPTVRTESPPPTPPQRTTRPPEPLPQDIIAIFEWDPSGKHGWRLMPSCPNDEAARAQPESIRTTSQAYLAQKGLLPAKYHLCISRLPNDEWQATCIPARQYLNSPVTLVIASGKVRDHYFSDAADPIEDDQ